MAADETSNNTGGMSTLSSREQVIYVVRSSSKVS